MPPFLKTIVLEPSAPTPDASKSIAKIKTAKMALTVLALSQALSQTLLSSMAQAQPPEPRKEAPVLALPVPEEDPAFIVRNFVTALTTRFNVEVAAFQVKGGATGVALKPIAAELEKERAGWMMSVEDLSVQEEGDTARVKLRLMLRHRLFGKIEHQERMALEKVRGTWKIVPLSTDEFYRARNERFDSDILTTYATYLARPQEVHEASAYECMSNLKQLALGVMQFVQDYDETYKLKAATYHQSILPYVKSTELFFCPDDKEGWKEGEANKRLSYSFNKSLENITLAQVPEPARTVLLYEGQNEQLIFRHNNRAAVCFADGHCQLVTPELAKTLRWKP